MRLLHEFLVRYRIFDIVNFARDQVLPVAKCRRHDILLIFAFTQNRLALSGLDLPPFDHLVNLGEVWSLGHDQKSGLQRFICSRVQ